MKTYQYNKLSQALILAAGYGERMQPLTLKTPKPLIKLLKKPLISYILDQLIMNNIRYCFINSHYLYEKINNYAEKFQKLNNYPIISVAYEKIEVDEEASAAIKKMKGNFVNADLTYALTVDKRNQAFKPTQGYKTTFRQALPLIQDSSSIMNGLDVSTYHDFSEDVIGSLKFHARTINGVDEDVRLTNRLYIPRNKLRGFNTYKVGPRDGTDYIGGNYVTALGFEAQLPNLLPESYRTDFSLFLDSANVWGVDYTSMDDTNTIRSSVGISANIFTTIGPLSFTMAQDLSKATNDQTEAFNFRLGTSF